MSIEKLDQRLEQVETQQTRALIKPIRFRGLYLMWLINYLDRVRIFPIEGVSELSTKNNK